MQLTVWTYEGPPHIGAMRIAASMRGVHCVLHAPQGDTYADLLFTMIERSERRPPVTYTTFKARDLGTDTAELLKTCVQGVHDRFRPDLMLVGEACTAELLQDQAGTLAQSMGLPIPVVPLELSAYSRARRTGGPARPSIRSCGASCTSRCRKPGAAPRERPTGTRPKANLLGPTSLGFRCRDDVTEVTRLLNSIGVDVNLVAPLGASPADIARIPEADFNCCLYPEVALSACSWLERMFKQPTVKTIPIGVGATRDFLREVGALTGIDVSAALAAPSSRLPWYSRSVDSTYLTGKRVYHLRRRHPCHRGGADLHRGTGVPGGRTRHLRPRTGPRGARRRPALRHRGPDHGRLSGGRGAGRGSCIRSWCSAPRWSATSPNGSASPAPSSARPSTSRTARPATPRRWVSKGPTSSSIPGSIR